MKKVANFIDLVHQQQRCCDVRRLLVLSGKRGWIETQIAALVSDLEGWLLVAAGDHGLAIDQAHQVVSGKQAHQVLGQEYPGIIFDSWGGFNPNAFGQVCGTLKAGGLMILLVPPLEEWPLSDDPERNSLVTGAGSADDVGHRLIDHLIRTIREDSNCLVLEQGGELPPLPDFATAISSTASVPEQPFLTCDQQRVVNECVEQFTQNETQVTVITADRGRGKSATLGLIAARLMEDSDIRIVVTAPGRAAVEPLFARLLEFSPEQERNQLSLGNSQIRFFLPDQLLSEKPEADLLLVDEAAAIPAPVLRQLLDYPQVIYASTIHGYEGTGQGFAVRFLERLSHLRPEWRHFKMSQPIRWGNNDPLEAFCYRALLLDAEPVPLTGAAHVRQPLIFQKLNRDALVQQPDMLNNLFGLLILAHYRTTPGDLRILLDSPNLQVWAALANIDGRTVPVATALLAEEGPIDSHLAAEIQAGRRRPKGQLIPQTLLAHGQLQEAARYRGLRVMRIAVHPDLQRQTVGSSLLRAIEQQAVADGYDWFGTSFGLTSGLLKFWLSSGMQPVRLGYRRDKVSATYAAIMLKGFTEGARSLQCQAWLRCFSDVEHRDDLNPSLKDLFIRLSE